ncbi:MAG: PEP/pyruvate-binding domain-containing protein [archaeon]
MNFVLPFKKLSRKSVSVAGGKGAQLGEMFNSKIPVPNGFVVSAESFDFFLKENNLNPFIESELKKVNQKKTDSVNTASEKIRKEISRAKMPKETEKEILKEFTELKANYVAVRSSATAEDAKNASWAGELESYTHITKKDLLNSVKKCWSSLFTPRAIFYRKEKKLKGKISVGVVIQKMVESDSSGVVFTVNPVTKNKNEIVIEAAFGLGESVVSGAVTPDKYLVNKTEMFIENIEVNKQEHMLALKNGKTTKIQVKKSEQENQKLSGKQIMELAELCKKIESHYNFPQDIEFALEKQKLFILQSRPITTL